MIEIYADYESLSRAAGQLFARCARKAMEDHGHFSVALAGGNTPRRTYELLAEPPLRSRVRWDMVHIFWGDERCVPPEDPQSNEQMARKALLDQVPVSPPQLHPIRCAESPERAAERYDMLLHNFFRDRAARFDLVLLGLGENGHTASLFPNSPVLDEQERWAADVYVPEQDSHRVTLTIPLINQAAVVAFLVSGRDKAEVLQKVLKGSEDPHSLPARLVQPMEGELHWLVDQEAASLVSP